MTNRSAIDSSEDPQEALGRWKAHRQAAKVDYRKILNERENALLEANARCGPKSQRVQNARDDLEDAELQRQEIHSVLRRPLNRFHFRPRNFVLFAIVLALLEGSVNKFLFDVALQSYGFVSYATSFVIAFCILILAHLGGRSLRQVWSEYRRKVVWSSVVIFIAITCALVGIVCIFTVGRAMTAAGAGMVTFDEVFGAVKSSLVEIGVWATVAAAFGNLNALILATVNIAGIFAAMMLAFFTHDPDRDYDLAATKVERHRRELDQFDEEYTRAKTRVIAKYASHLGAVGGRFKASNKEVMQRKHMLGLPPEPDDELMIDEWDDLAETSEHGDKEPARSGPPDHDGSGKPHLSAVREPRSQAGRA
ncbi:MAG: chloride channel protein [Bauldia sp.]|nr:chloride channel protein [Bauldia sp.]